MAVGDLAGGFTNLGGAVSGLFGAFGSEASASAYGEAKDIANQQAQIAQQSTAIQEAQKQRQIYQTISGQQADIAGAGLASSGSAQYLLRSSAQQGALSKQLVQAQGFITEKGYEEQAQAYAGMQKASEAAGTGGFLSSALGAVGAGIKLGGFLGI